MNLDRRIPKLENLNPKSVIKIFTEIDLFINDLDNHNVKNSKDLDVTLNGGKFSPFEKYFIITYLEKYLDATKEDSFLSREIDKREIHNDFDDAEDLYNWKIEITSHAKEILKKIGNKKSTISRSYKVYLRTEQNKFSFHQLEYATNHERLPLPTSYKLKVEREEFIQKVLKLLNGAGFDDYSAWEIIHNSFETNNVWISSPSEFLYFEYENRAELNKCFLEIYMLYGSLRKELKRDAKINKIDLYKKCKANPELLNLVGKGKTRRGHFTELAQDAIFVDRTLKIEFAYIMFLSFPQIRDNFFNRPNKNENFTTYLSSMAEDNIRN